jgi:hypothetical protein
MKSFPRESMWKRPKRDLMRHPVKVEDQTGGCHNLAGSHLKFVSTRQISVNFDGLANPTTVSVIGSVKSFSVESLLEHSSPFNLFWPDLRATGVDGERCGALGQRRGMFEMTL